MNEFYDDREQSLAKHQILGRYLVPFANKILSKWDSIDFIDGFSGPWKNVDAANLTDTSIGISLKKLSKVAEARGHTKANRKIRCIFNEANPVAFARLKEFTDRCSTDFPLLKIEIFHGEFESNAAKIRLSANHAFQLLFVDPTGYTGFPPSALKMFKGRSTEIIVNFMRSFIERFVSGDHQHKMGALVGLVGETRARYLIDTGLTIKTLEDEYLKMLRADLGYKFVAYSPIHNPDKNEIHFNLAYGTNHFEGMEVLRNSEYVALSEHDMTRFKRSVERRDGDLFVDMFDEMEIVGPYLKARKEHLDRAGAYLRKLISEGPADLKFCELAALAQQSLYLKRSELGDVVVNMAADNIVVPTWLERNGRKPRREDLMLLLKK